MNNLNYDIINYILNIRTNDLELDVVNKELSIRYYKDLIIFMKIIILLIFLIVRHQFI